MDPNASTGRDDDRNSATRPLGSMRPSSTPVLLSPHPRRSADQGEEDMLAGSISGDNSGNEDDVDHGGEELLSAQMADPEADRLLLHREFQKWIAQQESSDKAGCIVGGVNFSKRTKQDFCLLLVALAVAALIAPLFAADVVGPQSLTSAAATSSSMLNPPLVSGFGTSAQASRSSIAATTPSLQAPTKLRTRNPTTVPARSTGTAVDPTPDPSPLPLTPAPISPGHGAQWVQVGNDIDVGNPFDESDISVAFSSNGAVVAIGAGGVGRAGHVRVYFYAGGGWQQRGSDLDGSTAGEEFGFSVSLSADGTILAVGAILADGVNGESSGQVHVFRWISNTSWQPLGSTLDGARADDWFGYSIALSDDGTILAVGGLGLFNDAGGTSAGHVRVVAWADTDWTQRGNDLLGSSPGDFFGASVSLSSDGSVLACGGDQFRNQGPGYVKVYHWSGSAWQQQGSTLMGFSPFGGFGESVSLSGDGSILAVGAASGNYIVVYRNDGSDWVQIGQTIRGGDGERSGDGIKVSLSFNGKTMLIGGSLWGDSIGKDVGHSLVFRLSRNEQEWMQVGQELVVKAPDNSFGRSTSISDSGMRISIGVWGNDGRGRSVGQVQVYDLK